MKYSIKSRQHSFTDSVKMFALSSAAVIGSYILGAGDALAERIKAPKAATPKRVAAQKAPDTPILLESLYNLQSAKAATTQSIRVDGGFVRKYGADGPSGTLGYSGSSDSLLARFEQVADSDAHASSPDFYQDTNTLERHAMAGLYSARISSDTTLQFGASREDRLRQERVITPGQYFPETTTTQHREEDVDYSVRLAFDVTPATQIDFEGGYQKGNTEDHTRLTASGLVPAPNGKNVGVNVDVQNEQTVTESTTTYGVGFTHKTGDRSRLSMRAKVSTLEGYLMRNGKRVTSWESKDPGQQYDAAYSTDGFFINFQALSGSHSSAADHGSDAGVTILAQRGPFQIVAEYTDSALGGNIGLFHPDDRARIQSFEEFGIAARGSGMNDSLQNLVLNAERDRLLSNLQHPAVFLTAQGVSGDSNVRVGGRVFFPITDRVTVSAEYSANTNKNHSIHNEAQGAPVRREELINAMSNESVNLGIVYTAESGRRVFFNASNWSVVPQGGAEQHKNTRQANDDTQKTNYGVSFGIEIPLGAKATPNAQQPANNPGGQTP